MRQGFDGLERVVDRSQKGWDRARRSNDDFYLDAVALNLPGFSSALERIFSLIAESADASMPRGENRHMLLLGQMTEEHRRVRPAVISKQAGKRLNEYRGFLQVVRNGWAHPFDPLKVEGLVNRAPALFSQLKLEIPAFADFLSHPWRRMHFSAPRETSRNINWICLRG